MSVRVRHHVNPLSIHGQADRRVGAPLALPAGAEVEVELGCADARFLFERARNRPQGYHVGVEIRRPLVDEVNAIARSEGTTNLQVVFANISTELGTLLPAERIRRFFVLFPDPWFKRRHHKRRLMTPDLLTTLCDRLVRDGEIYFATDVFDLALDAIEVFEAAAPRLQNLHGPWSFARSSPFPERSKRQVACDRWGRRTWRLHYRLSSG
jgi:tRNA (guanine-N7-)-methyltransferase